MTTKGKAFAGGGLGCLVAFGILAVLALAFGGTAYANVGGLVVLFVIGGLLGLGINAIYERGKRSAARRERDPPSTDPPLEP